MLLGITAMVVVLIGVLAWLLNASVFGSLGDSIWQNLMHAIDAGTLAGLSTESGAPFVALMTITTVCGIFITSMLIDIINSGLESKFENLRGDSTSDAVALERCSLESCRSVIVNEENDVKTIRTILAATNYLKSHPENTAHITAVVREESNVDVAQLAGQALVNPPMDTVIGCDDELIVIAED